MLNTSKSTSLTNRLGTDIPLYNQGGLWYCRKNGICTVGFKGVANNSTFQLPDGMKPKAYVTLYGQSPTNAYMVLDTDGIIHCYSNATYKLFGTVSYPALDA